MKALYLAAGLAVMLALAFPTASDSCGIAPPAPIFSTGHRPANLAGEFLKGKIGVIRPSYDRRYLIGAYRMLSRKPLTSAEIEGLYPQRKAAVALINGPVRGEVGWTQNVTPFTGGRPVFIDPYKIKQNPGSFVQYVNCTDAAFDSALDTLLKRMKQWGANDPRVGAWVDAQQQVFANCSGTNVVIPAAPDARMDPALAADRRYQIAASYFYAGDWTNARGEFTKIAADSSSPWSGIAPFLIARTYIREGTIEENRDALVEAAKRLQAIVDDPAQQPWHEASRKLLGYVSLRIDPTERLAELGQQLMGAQASPEFAQSVTDFLYLYNRQSGPKDDIAPLAASSDLADWMLAFEGHPPKTGNHAAEQWKKTRNAAWLIATLAQGDDSEAMAAAKHRDPRATEYESAAYYALLRIADHDEARRWADDVLSHNLVLSTRNLFLAERLKLARDWNEFLRYAPRRPEPKLESYDGDEEPADKPPVATGAAALFDQDSARLLNRRVPLSLWVDASRNALLPAHLQLQIGEAAWVRALVLGKDADARALIERIVQLQPGSMAAARDYLTASDPDAARFAAVFLLLRATLITPYVEPGADAGNLSQVSRLGAVEWGFADPCVARSDTVPTADAGFLDSEQRAENDAEWKQMEAAAPSGGGFLAANTLAWARRHPDDARVPEALHLIVESGRRACRGQAPADDGRAAFQLLHRRYPKSEWTQKTKYWYQ